MSNSRYLIAGFRLKCYRFGNQKTNLSIYNVIKRNNDNYCLFHCSDYRTFKMFYTGFIWDYHSKAFPELVSYNRFIELKASALIPLCCYLNFKKGKATGISFVDSTSIRVCNNRRIHSHNVFKKFAKRGKNSIGQFYGFKLCLF